ncbi:15967_t:CDS:2 [Dentiscutata heterogama]|uniref:15967_t:CDS:1 n=1 Tax=Dentiscutata heterogama TaxID=1316150 RepID=A0ACA9KEE0_9GLOM|nr:15967_t:CDS:2 [Dentiscutata heterogama]
MRGHTVSMYPKKDLLDKKATTLFRLLKDEQVTAVLKIINTIFDYNISDEQMPQILEFMLDNTEDFKYDKDANMDTSSSNIVELDNNNKKSYVPEYKNPVLDIAKSYLKKETLNKKNEKSEYKAFTYQKKAETNDAELGYENEMLEDFTYCNEDKINNLEQYHQNESKFKIDKTTSDDKADKNDTDSSVKMNADKVEDDKTIDKNNEMRKVDELKE